MWRLSRLAQQALSHALGGLRNIPRIGYSELGVPLSRVQSVFEHVAQTQKIAKRLARQAKANARRCDELVLAHDLTECITGDISFRVAKFLEKHRLRKSFERYALSELISQFPEAVQEELRNYLKPLVDEFLLQRTLEARLVDDADAIERGIESITLVHEGYLYVQEIVDRIDKETLVRTPAGQGMWKKEKKRREWQ